MPLLWKESSLISSLKKEERVTHFITPFMQVYLSINWVVIQDPFIVFIIVFRERLILVFEPQGTWCSGCSPEVGPWRTRVTHSSSVNLQRHAISTRSVSSKKTHNWPSLDKNSFFSYLLYRFFVNWNAIHLRISYFLILSFSNLLSIFNRNSISWDIQEDDGRGVTRVSTKNRWAYILSKEYCHAIFEETVFQVLIKLHKKETRSWYANTVFFVKARVAYSRVDKFKSLLNAWKEHSFQKHSFMFCFTKRNCKVLTKIFTEFLTKCISLSLFLSQNVKLETQVCESCCEYQTLDRNASQVFFAISCHHTFFLLLYIYILRNRKRNRKRNLNKRDAKKETWRKLFDCLRRRRWTE